MAFNPSAPSAAREWKQRQGFNQRHWCVLCRTWLQGDPKSIFAHETANRHRREVARRLESTRREREKRAEREADPRGKGHASRVAQEADEESRGIVIRADQIPGQYSVRDQVHFEGDWHHDLLMESMSGNTRIRCQVSLPVLSSNDADANDVKQEEDDEQDDEPETEWLDCHVLSVDLRDIAAPVYTVRAVQRVEEPEGYRVNGIDLRIFGPSPPSLAGEWQTVDASARNLGDSSIGNEEHEESPAKLPEEYSESILPHDAPPTAQTTEKVVFKKRRLNKSST